MDEIIFEVHDAEEGGYVARALGQSIFTEGEDWEELRKMVRDAVACHFEDIKRQPGSANDNGAKGSIACRSRLGGMRLGDEFSDSTRLPHQLPKTPPGMSPQEPGSALPRPCEARSVGFLPM